MDKKLVSAMVTFPNAKINLGLDILDRRTDGYHDISTVMVPVPWCDILEVVPAKDGRDSLTTTGRQVDCPPEKNLVMRAVRALREHFEFPGVDIHLHKVIPDGAGLGGGSADAAFTLTAIDSLYGLNVGKDSLARIVSAVGADCPFFIYNVPMLCTGIGTDLSPLSFTLPEPLWIAIVKPPVSVPTKEAYSHVVPGLPEVDVAEIVTAVDCRRWQGQLKNDFEVSVFPRYPRIGQIKAGLLAMGAVYASMSGSGSAVFALFDNPDAEREVSAAFPDCDIFFRQFSIG